LHRVAWIHLVTEKYPSDHDGKGVSQDHWTQGVWLVCRTTGGAIAGMPFLLVAPPLSNPALGYPGASPPDAPVCGGEPPKVDRLRPWDTGVTATRDEIHRLVDGVPEDRVAAIGEVLHAALEAGLTGDQVRRLVKHLRADPDLTLEPIRKFASAGTLSAEPDLAERIEEILRAEPPGTAA
jgi:alkylated DNA nucleotide flippase Atl1